MGKKIGCRHSLVAGPATQKITKIAHGHFVLLNLANWLRAVNQKGGAMSIAVIGGIDRLRRFYEKKGFELGYKVKVFGRQVPDIRKRLNGFNGIVLFTSTVSHNLVKEVLYVARKQRIPIERNHSSSLSGLKRCLKGLALI